MNQFLLLTNYQFIQSLVYSLVQILPQKFSSVHILALFWKLGFFPVSWTHDAMGHCNDSVVHCHCVHSQCIHGLFIKLLLCSCCLSEWAWLWQGSSINLCIMKYLSKLKLVRAFGPKHMQRAHWNQLKSEHG